MEDVSEREKIFLGVKSQLSALCKSLGWVMISCTIHDYITRKELKYEEGSYFDYKLMRVKFIYQEKRTKEQVHKTLIVYPRDVIPYVRRTLNFLEKVVREKIIDAASYYELERRYEISYKAIRLAVKKVEVAFNFLLSIGLIKGRDMKDWLKEESRTLSQLSMLYQEKFWSLNPRLALICIFIK